jgi:DNA-binding transcriptional LysR family regulator
MTGEVDLGMAHPPVRRPGLVSRPLLHEQLIAALPEAHPMASLGRQLTLNDLDGQDVIMYSPVQARYFNELLISTFTIAGATPRYVQTVTQVHTMLVLVRSGIGIALVPASAATLHPEGLVFRSIGRSGSDRWTSTRCGAATAQTPPCCDCSETSSRNGNGPPTTSSRTSSASVHAVA